VDDVVVEPITAPGEEPDDSGWESRWRTAAAEHLGNGDAPVRSEVGEYVVLQWTNDLIAIALPDTPRELQHDWEERGYTFVRFASDESTWKPTFIRLARLLGVPPASNR
jgi:hypothetical protein